MSHADPQAGQYDANRRVLMIDDTEGIHADLQKLLRGSTLQSGPSSDLARARAAFFGTDDEQPAARLSFALDSAYSGEQGLEMAREALELNKPYALALVDHRMPNGWDGIETIRQLWQVDPDLQVVLCTAYSDCSWDETVAALGCTDRLLILKKPFEPVEIRQMAAALTEKWNARSRERILIEDLKAAQAEQRAYSSSLETMNLALSKAQAASDLASSSRAKFLVKLADQVCSDLGALLNKVLLDEQNVDLPAVIDSSSRVLETLTRVTDLHQLEAGHWGLCKTSVSVGDLLTRAVQPFRAQAIAKGLTLEIDTQERSAHRIECDADRLGQVLTHLVENAVRHTEAGNITLRAAILPTGTWERSRLVLSVEDTGPGLSPELGGRPFEPFVAHAGGVGLGLAIVRGLARLMGASVTHEALEGGGTAFRFSMETLIREPRPFPVQDPPHAPSTQQTAQ